VRGLGGGEFVERRGADGGVGGLPTAFFHLGGERLPDGFADLAGGDTEVVDLGHGLAVGADELIVDGEKFESGGARFGDDAGAEAGVGRADDQALRAAGGEIVDGGEDLLAIGGADFHESEPEFLRGLVGELPFQLEPRLLGLLHEEADLDGRGGVGGEGQHGQGG
jgi:hypothetical protein